MYGKIIISISFKWTVATVNNARQFSLEHSVICDICYSNLPSVSVKEAKQLQYFCVFILCLNCVKLIEWLKDFHENTEEYILVFQMECLCYCFYSQNVVEWLVFIEKKITFTTCVGNFGTQLWFECCLPSFPAKEVKHYNKATSNH